MLAACVLRNLTTTSSLARTPLEMWSGKKPSIVKLMILRRKASCLYDKTKRGGKYGVKAWVGPPEGYFAHTPWYRVWDPKTHEVWNVRKPEFNESVKGG